MQFKNPEFLFALFLLVIPIIVHLFQLRRFKKEAFTNVKFLKKVQLQTRKSAEVKKWLSLLARLLALAAIIIAFAQPYIPQSQSALKKKETVVYIDNSFSMQQKGEQSELMKHAVQQLLQNFPKEQEIRVFTNDQVFPKSSLSELKNDLLHLKYSPEEASLKTVALKANNLFSKDKNVQKNFIAISDFQEKNLKKEPKFDKTTRVEFIQLKGKSHLNISIDSVYFGVNDLESSELKVKVSASRANTKTLPISLYQNENLWAKSSIGFDHDSIATTTFSLSQDQADLQGKMVIEDHSLRFDNTFYFSLQKPRKIKVVAVIPALGKELFLKKIFKHNDFDFTAMTVNQLDYNTLEKADFIVLNELKNIPNGMGSILEEKLKNGGYVTIIPGLKVDLTSYNKLFAHLGIGQLSDFNENPLKITSINFDHPLYNQVFDGKVTNFQYPSVQGYFEYVGSGNRVLGYNNGRDFLTEIQHCYIFTSPLNEKNSNFTRSPLIVPTFYNMAKQSLKLPKLFYTIGKRNTITIPTDLNKDKVLYLKKGKSDFIPQQGRFNEKVEIVSKDLPKEAGTYQIVKAGKSIGHLSYNYDRSENQLTFANMRSFKNAHTSNDVEKFFTSEINKNQVDQLWKWFVIFAIVFLLVEVALLKFLK